MVLEGSRLGVQDAYKVVADPDGTMLIIIYYSAIANGIRGVLQGYKQGNHLS